MTFPSFEYVNLYSNTLINYEESSRKFSILDELDIETLFDDLEQEKRIRSLRKGVTLEEIKEIKYVDLRYFCRKNFIKVVGSRKINYVNTIFKYFKDLDESKTPKNGTSRKNDN